MRVERHQLAPTRESGRVPGRCMSCSHTSTRITLTASSTTGGCPALGLLDQRVRGRIRERVRAGWENGRGMASSLNRAESERQDTDRPTAGLLSDGRRVPGRPVAAQRRAPAEGEIPRFSRRPSACSAAGRPKSATSSTAAQPVPRTVGNRLTTRGCAGWKPEPPGRTHRYGGRDHSDLPPRGSRLRRTAAGRRPRAVGTPGRLDRCARSWRTVPQLSCSRSGDKRSIRPRMREAGTPARRCPATPPGDRLPRVRRCGRPRASLGMLPWRPSSPASRCRTDIGPVRRPPEREPGRPDGLDASGSGNDLGHQSGELAGDVGHGREFCDLPRQLDMSTPTRGLPT